MSGTKISGSVRERLLQAADELFYHRGVHTVGIDSIITHAGVARGSLYGTFGSKDELVRAYLEGRDSWLRERIDARIAQAGDSIARIVAIFDEFAERVAEDEAYCGCPFIRACAETPQETNSARDVSSQFRKWRRELFLRLAREAGLSDAEAISQQLSLIYDGATVAVAMDGDAGAAIAARNIVVCILTDAVGRSARQKHPARLSRRQKTGH